MILSGNHLEISGINSKVIQNFGKIDHKAFHILSIGSKRVKKNDLGLGKRKLKKEHDFRKNVPKCTSIKLKKEFQAMTF